MSEKGLAPGHFAGGGFEDGLLRHDLPVMSEKGLAQGHFAGGGFEDGLLQHLIS